MTEEIIWREPMIQGRIWHAPPEDREAAEGDGECPGAYKRIYARVDLDALLENVDQMKKSIGPDTRIMAVVKTDGYGHGSVPVARTLEGQECIYGFAVATAEEAFALRRAGIRKPVLILGYAFSYGYEEMIRQDIRLTVFREDTARLLSELATAQDKKARVHVKVDTGMGRIGIRPDEKGLALIRLLHELPGIEVEGIFTHFARADEKDKESAERQLATFCEFVKTVRETVGAHIPVRHCANSAAILEMPGADLDVVRAGIALYGVYPSEEVDRKKVALHPVLSLYSHIVYIKEVLPGEHISYGGTFRAEKKMRVATIPVGYGDGYPRSLSGRGYVLIRGQRAPIVGRICMDQLMVDVSHIPDAAMEDQVTLLGRDGGEEIDAELLGELSGRFHYELLCLLGKRIPRVYVKKSAD